MAEASSAAADRVTGTLVGLAVGDALGAPLEFMPRSGVRQRFPHGLRVMITSSLWAKGEYTDDTEMALILAESLLAHGRLVATDVASRFREWAQSAKDVGTQTRAVLGMRGYLADPEDCASRYYSSHPDSSAGNGALMRCAPTALFRLRSRALLIEESRLSARVTHGDPRAQSSCVLLNVWIADAILNGARDARTLAISSLPKEEQGSWQRLPDIHSLEESVVESSGYTVHTLEAAAWSFLTTGSFEEAVVRAANLGDDADTVAAVTGALAGAYYGYSSIPQRWIADLKDEPRIRSTALALAGL